MTRATRWSRLKSTFASGVNRERKIAKLCLTESGVLTVRNKGDLVNQESLAVVIPAYNAGSYLRRAVDSVFATNYPNIEVIVVDDGSGDDTLAIAHALCNQWGSGCRVVLHPDRGNHGVSASRNLGINSTSTKWVAFLDADDYYLPNRFDSLRELCNGDPPDMLYQLALVAFESDNSGGWVSNEPHLFGVNEDLDGTALLARLLRGQCLQASAVTLKRQLFDRIGLFDVDRRIAEDCHMWMRAAIGGRVGSGDLSLPVSVYWRHETNTYSYKLEHRVELLGAMLDVRARAAATGCSNDVTQTFKAGTRAYALGSVVVMRESSRNDLAASVLKLMLRTGDLAFFMRGESVRQSLSVAGFYLSALFARLISIGPN